MRTSCTSNYMGCKPAAVVPTFERFLRDVYTDSWEDFCTSPCAGAFLKLVPWSTWALDRKYLKMQQVGSSQSESMRSGSGLLRWFCSVVVPIDIKGCKWIWYLTIWPTLPQAPQEKKLDRDSNSRQVQGTGMVRSSSSNVRYFLSRDLTFFDFECNPQGDGLCLFTLNVMKMILCYFMLFYDLISKSMFDIILRRVWFVICVRGPSCEWAPAQMTDVFNHVLRNPYSDCHRTLGCGNVEWMVLGFD